MEKVLPVSILITSYNRKNLLSRCVQLINERTFYPYRIIVVDNNSTDGSQGLLKEMKVQGKIFDCVFMPENVGQCKALNEGFRVIEEWENNEQRMHRPSNDFIVTSQEDIYPPLLGQDNCWLAQMIKLLEKNEPEYGGLSMRIQRTPRTDIDEGKDITPAYKNFPSVFRLMRRSDLRKLGDDKFGHLLKWESNSTGENYKNQIRKKFGFTTHIFADHAGFMLEKKGYGEEVNTFTVAANKLNERNEKPYPEIDPVTNIPTKINHGCDSSEQLLRDNYQKAIKGEHVGSEITLIVLTCKRLDGLKRIINSIKEKTKDVLYDLLVVADNDSTDEYDYCLENGISCILSNERRDFTAQANLGVYACKTPLFVILADDMEVVKDNWLGEALRTFKEKFLDKNGLMSFNENIQKGRIFTCGMASKRFVQEMGGNLYFPLYNHFKGDREVTELAKALNLYHYAESVVVEHYHPTHPDEKKRNQRDETYSNSEQSLGFDRALKNNRPLEKILKDRNKCLYE